MLYYLFQYLEQSNFPGARMFGYVSFRSLMAIILALLISAIFGEFFINLLKKKQITETQRDASIDPFNVKKTGVPTMGGIIIIVAILIPCLLLGKLHNIYMILMLITTVWLGTLGFLDDYIKVFRKDKEGLHGKFKIIGQVGLGLIVGLTLYLSPDVVIRENIEIQQNGRVVDVVHKSQNEKSTKTTIPFFKNNNLDYADFVGFMGEHAQAAGWIVFVLITIFVVTAVSNGANLNDGMDGMAAGNSAIMGVTLGILAYVSSHIEYAQYLNIMYIPGSEELVLMVQRVSRTSVHGRHGKPHHRRHHRRICHHHPQRTADSDSLRGVLGGELVGNPSSEILPVREKERNQTAHLQAHADSRPFPHDRSAARPELFIYIHAPAERIP